jgi:hypothetical protein
VFAFVIVTGLLAVINDRGKLLGHTRLLCYDKLLHGYSLDASTVTALIIHTKDLGQVPEASQSTKSSRQPPGTGVACPWLFSP